MKCGLCGVDNLSEPKPDPSNQIGMIEAGPAGLTLTVPPRGTDPFVAVWGLWDHRRQQRRDICGACLCDLIFGVPLEIIGGTIDAGVTGPGAAVPMGPGDGFMVTADGRGIR